MAGTNGASIAAIRETLLRGGRSFSFFQAMRLLGNLAAGEARELGGRTGAIETFRVRPSLSLAFAGTDIESIEESATGKLILTANILGLYGTGSPLPVFYTEELFEGQGEERDTAREFVDVINHRLYELLYAGWAKYQTVMKVIEEEDARYEDRLFSLAGLGTGALREGLDHPRGLLRYTGLLSQGTRSASGLATLLTDALGGTPVEVVQAVKRKVPICPSQHFILGVSGNVPGESGYLGTEFEESAGAVVVRVGPLSEEAYRQTLPGTETHRLIVSLTRFYLNTPLQLVMEVVMDAAVQKETVHLGGSSWSRLGLDTWVFSGESPGELCTRFYP